MSNIIYLCFESWKSAGFATILKDLDIIACSIANEKDQIDVSRRVLIEKNKKFKEQVSLETRKEVAPLLKSFQNEVDSLNKRNKSLETHLLTLYKNLIDLPDPLNALDLSLQNQKKLQKFQDIVFENKKLRETLEDYQEEFSGIKNQEVTIKKLRDKVKDYESNLASSIDVKCKEMEREMKNSFAEKERELIKEKNEALHKVDDCESKISLMERNLVDCQSELFQMKNRFDEFAAAKMSETDILMNENERTIERLRQLENWNNTANDGCKDNFVLSKNSFCAMENDEKETNQIAELQMELDLKESQIMKVNKELLNVKSQLVHNEELNQEKLNRLGTELEEHKKVISQLQSDFRSQSDYDEIKKELFIIKSIEFQNFDQTSNPAEYLSVPTKSIEQLLNEKNRHLQNELVQLKANFALLQLENQKLIEDVNEKRAALQKKSQLVDELEEDLRKMKTFHASALKTEEKVNQLSPIVVKKNEANILTDVLELSHVNNDDSSVDIHFGEGGRSNFEFDHNSILAIVQSQRDRFKVRSQELEADAQGYQQTIHNLQVGNEQIRSDNVKLYEKIRFLQSYSRSSKNVVDDNVMSRYSSAYEANINPFETFNRREKMKQYDALPAHEKIVLNLGQFLMRNRTARLVAFIYSLLLHFLIFVVLYKLAYTEICVRDQAFECRKEFAEHMKMHKNNKI